MGTERIFPGRIFKFGRHFERVEKKLNFSMRDTGHLNACAHARMAHFFLKIDFFVTAHEDKPIPLRLQMSIRPQERSRPNGRESSIAK